MVRKMLWTEDAGRRVKLRDLHVFLNAARSGSMAQAAKKLGVSQPTISEAIIFIVLGMPRLPGAFTFAASRTLPIG